MGHQVKIAVQKLTKDHNFLSLAANITGAAAGLLSFILLTRVLSIDDFGKWILFITPAGFVDMFRLGLIREAIVRFLAAPSPSERKYYLGSSWFLGLTILLGVSIILWTVIAIFPKEIQSSGYDEFFYWYPLYGLACMPWHIAWAILQAELEFAKIFWLRFFNLCSFLLILLLGYFLFPINIRFAIILLILSHGFTSLFCLFRKWTGIEFMRYISKEKVKVLLAFGQFSMATRIGSSLLKGADSLIIGLSVFLGPAGVAIYAIPLKYLEFVEIPLISFATTAFPKLSKVSIENNIDEFKKLFYEYTGAIIYLFIAIALFSFLFAKPFITILGGPQYHALLPEISLILYVFIIFALMLPLDRFTGVALDSLNRPQKNFYKILFMAGANIIGDFVVVFGFHALFPSMSATTLLFFVACVSILFNCIGLVVGYHYLKQEIDISFLKIFTSGFYLYKEYTNKILLKIKRR